MCDLESFKVDLREAKDGGKHLAYDLDDSYFEAMDGSEVRRGAVNVTVSIHNTAGIYEMTFRCEGSVEVQCDLCLDDMDQPLRTEDKLLARLGAGYSETDDIITVDQEEGIIDLSWFIYEFIVLAIPVRHVHKPGQCNPVMTAILKEHTPVAVSDGEQNEGTDPQWNELKKLKTIIKD